LSWMLVPIAGLVVFVWTTNESEVSDPRGRIALGAAMLLHLVGKVLFFPGLLAQVPLSSLLSPLPSQLLGRWVLPLLLAALSAGAMRLYLRRARSESILIAYLVYAIVDSLLTLVIYVALPMG
jgi:hypothetical protein